jgi:HEAT repeat protein
MVRASYLHALGRIGSKEAVPGLVPLAEKGLWEQREPVLDALGLLGDSHEAAAVETLMRGEGARVKSECADSPDNSLCKNLPALTHRRAEVYKQRIAELKAGEKCGDKLDCWAQAMEDPNPGIRVRAALTLGRSGQANRLGGVLKHLSDSDREARLAVILAADWLTQNAEAAKTARASLPAMEAQLTQDEGKSDWVESSDNLKRLVAKLKRSN